MSNLSLFESDSNPLKDSLKNLLENLPKSQEHSKSLFKSLLVHHVNNIQDEEERSTWLSFIDTLENLSEDQQCGSTFGPRNHQVVFSHDFDQFLKEESQYDSAEKHYEKNLKFKAYHGIKLAIEIQKEQFRALKCVMLVSLRLRYVESFWLWHMQAQKEPPHYFQKRCSSVFKALKAHYLAKQLKTKKLKKAQDYWRKRRILLALVSWVMSIRQNYREKRHRSQEPRHYRVGRISTDHPLDLRKSSVRPKLKYSLPPQDLELLNKSSRHFSQKLFKKSFKAWNSFINLKYKKTALKKRSKLHLKSLRLNRSFKIWSKAFYFKNGSFALADFWNYFTVKNSFEKIRLRAFSEKPQTKPKQNLLDGCLDCMSDQDLVFQIQILKKKLSSLNQELVQEQLTQHKLLAHKQELLNCYF